MNVGDKIRMHRDVTSNKGQLMYRAEYFGFISHINNDGTYNVWYIDRNGSSHTRQDVKQGTGDGQIVPWVNDNE